jgi:hypothetical protein
VSNTGHVFDFSPVAARRGDFQGDLRLEAVLLVAADANTSSDGGLLQRRLALTRHAQKRASETSSIARGKELFRIGGLAARTAKLLRARKGKIKNAIG